MLTNIKKLREIARRCQAARSETVIWRSGLGKPIFQSETSLLRNTGILKRLTKPVANACLHLLDG